ncbi:MAG: PA14 domain-containing protein [Methylomonas sp.]|nr:PA14 domain-containing protein [Methylomonas sp.]
MIFSKWLKMSCGVLAIASSSPAYTCDAPVGRFCVDFYRGTNLEGKPLTTLKTPFIKYNWKNRSPVRRIPYDNFSARWRGQFDFKDGQYAFNAAADDGLRILLDGKPILDVWQGASAQAHKAEVSLDAGRHLVEVEYFEAKGNASIQVDWLHQSSAPTATDLKLDSPSNLSAAVNTQVGGNQTNTPAYKKTLVQNPNQVAIGVNLPYFSYSDPAVPFKDLITQSGLIGVIKNGTNDPCPEQPEFDETGYPRYLPAGCRFRLVSVFHILNDKFWPKGTPSYQSGHYVLLYAGNGNIRLSWDATNVKKISAGRIEFDVPKPTAGIMLEVLDTEPGNPVRDLHLVHEDYEASFRIHPFNEKWLKLLEPFSVLRFKDWGRIDDNLKVFSGTAVAHTPNSITLGTDAPADNGVFDNMVAKINLDNQGTWLTIARYEGSSRTLYLKSPIQVSKTGSQPWIYLFDFVNRSWDKRARPVTLDQSSSRGIAFETMIQLANTLNINPWINIPTAADDNFVEQLAMLIKAQLKPSLKVYLEYSNENWNSIFPGFHYANAKTEELQLSGTSPQSDAWHAYRSVEVFKIFNRVFGEPDLRENRTQSRLVRVLSSQTAWLDRSLRVMDWQMPNGAAPTNGAQANKFADAFAATTYFYIDPPELLDTVDFDALFSLQADNIDKMFGTQERPGIIRQLLAETNKRGLQLVTYEAGTHLLAPSGRDDLVAKLAAVNQDLRMKDVYGRLLGHWNQLYREFGKDEVGVWNQFSHISRYSQNGYWGLLQSTYQDPATAPKYQAILDFSKGSVQ